MPSSHSADGYRTRYPQRHAGCRAALPPPCPHAGVRHRLGLHVRQVLAHQGAGGATQRLCRPSLAVPRERCEALGWWCGRSRSVAYPSSLSSVGPIRPASSSERPSEHHETPVSRIPHSGSHTCRASLRRLGFENATTGSLPVASPAQLHAGESVSITVVLSVGSLQLGVFRLAWCPFQRRVMRFHRDALGTRLGAFVQLYAGRRALVASGSTRCWGCMAHRKSYAR